MSNHIDGVTVRALKVVPDERGFLMEIFRRDSPEFQQFGQVYMTAVYPGVVKAWHLHKVQVDNFAVIHGMVKVGLVDMRPDSKFQGSDMTIYAGEKNPVLIHVPPGIYHGFKGIGTDTALVVNVPTHPYDYENPDEFR